MKKRNLKQKAIVLGMTGAMTIGAMPVSALAVTGDQVAKDGTYTQTAHIESDDDWSSYDAEISLTVKDGLFESVTVTPSGDYEESLSQIRNATTANTSRRKGIVTVLTGQPATANSIESFDAVSNATITSIALKNAALAALSTAEEAAAEEPETPDVPENPDRTEEDTYVLMNIPYDAFYAAEVNNDVKVDAFSSATLNKPRTGSLAGGSYHVSAEGTDITGIIYPVKVPAGTDLSGFTKVTDEDSVDITVTNRGTTTTTTYSGKDALFENDSYAYYELSETPEHYKEMVISDDDTISFGSVQGEVKTAENVDAALSTNSQYGDYQLAFTGALPFDEDAVTVNGVVLTTTDGSSYGLRHMENIWRKTELAWSTGFTETVHNCPTSSAHYTSMMGKTLDKVTYYTSEGVYELDITDLYVPVKFDGTITANDTDVTAGTTTLTSTGVPEDFDAEFSVSGLTVTAAGETLSFDDAVPGSYTLVASDRSGKYAPLRSSFILSTTQVQAAYDSDAKALTAAEDVTAEQFSAYLKAISSVTVNDTSYAASGRGAVKLINADSGALDLSAAPFADTDATYNVTVTAVGYPDVTFTIEPKSDEEPETDDPDDQQAETVTVYRLYNRSNGDHFYTRHAEERANLIRVGWIDEGIGWTALETSEIPVYRLYNPNSGDHHFTTSKNEYDSLQTIGWRGEGIAWYSAEKENGVPLYRLFNPNETIGTHHYTLSEQEQKHLVSIGWKDEGIAWYAVKQ